MKNFIILAFAAMTFTACKSDKKNDVETAKNADLNLGTEMYACSMHPEVTGKKGDKCSKCGMELEKVTVATSTKKVKYACPMDTEITGKKGDKCSKCGMDLEEVKS